MVVYGGTVASWTDGSENWVVGWSNRPSRRDNARAAPKVYKSSSGKPGSLMSHAELIRLQNLMMNEDEVLQCLTHASRAENKAAARPDGIS